MLRTWQTAETFDDMFYYCTALLVHTFSHFIMMFHLNAQGNNDDV